MRRQNEFSVDALQKMAALIVPPLALPSTSWTLQEIRDARDAQLRGDFSRPARLVASMRTDDAIFTAERNRLAPQRNISVELKSAGGARGDAVAREADALFGDEGVGIAAGAIDDINAALANQGVGIGYNVPIPRSDGSRVDFVHHAWPLEHVRWCTIRRQLMAQIDPTQARIGDLEEFPSSRLSFYEVPIVHGDGRWVIYRNHEHEPWKHGTVLAASLVWARHAHAIRDWAKGSSAHGNAKVVGEMPAGIALADDSGNATKEALAFLALLQAIASLDSPVGIRPAGSKTDYITNNSTAWQVWLELVTNAEKAAARIYLGTDGILGAQGGAPGVDIAQLFGVATTIVQGDLGAIERGFLEGVLEPWCAVNFGDSSLAPSRVYLMPDADAKAARDDYAKRSAAFHVDVRAYRANGFVVDQTLVDRLAAQHGIEPPMLKPVEPPVAPPGQATPAGPALRAVTS